MDENQIKYFVEAALLASGRPLSIDNLQRLFDDASMPEKSQIRQAISSLLDDYEERGITVAEVASGFRIQIKNTMVEQLQKLWEERPPRYSRALFETLALIAYRQPMTRGEIEEIRGVSVSPNIIRSLLEREWIRIVGHRDVPGRPEMFGTTRLFLDYFGLKKLDDLPPLADISDWESLRVQLNLPAVEDEPGMEAPETAEVTEFPVAQSGETVDADETALEDEKAAVDEAGDSVHEKSTGDALAVIEDEVEPILATEWPDPNTGPAVIAAADVSQLREEKEEGEDAESSLTGA